MKRDLRRAPDHGELAFSSDLLVCEMSVEIINALDRRAVHCHDDVAFEYTRFFGRAVFFHRQDQHAACCRQAQMARERAGDRDKHGRLLCEGWGNLSNSCLTEKCVSTSVH